MRYLGLLLLTFSNFVISQDWEWVSTISGTNSDYGWDIEIDSQNNLIVTGRVKGNATFGNGTSSITLNAIGGETDIFLAKFDNQGQLIWGKRMGGVDPDWGRAIAIDNDDNIYFTGDFANSADFDGVILTGYDNGAVTPGAMARTGFVVKYDPSGNLIWANKFQGLTCKGHGIAVDINQNVYVTGEMKGLTDFGNSIITGEATTQGFGFIAKYDVTGACLWANYFDSPNSTRGYDVKVFSPDKILCTGYYTLQLLYDGQTISGTSATWGDYFLMQMDADGNYNWHVKGTGLYFNEGRSIHVSEDRAIYVTGTFSGTMNMVTDTLISLGDGTTATTINQNADAFIAKYDSLGNTSWVKSIGSNLRVETYGISSIDSDYLLVSGYSQDTIFLNEGNDTILTINNYDTGIIIALDTSGVFKWYKQMTPLGNPAAASYNAIYGGDIYSITTDNNGNIYSTGLFGDEGQWDDLYFDATSINHDAFIGKLLPPLNGEIISQISCAGDTSSFSVDHLHGSPLTYQWLSTNNNDIIGAGLDTMNLHLINGGTDTISYIVSNGFSTDTLITIFSANTPASVNLGSDIDTCEASIVLSGGSGSNLYYDWGFGAVLNDSLHDVMLSGEYTLMVSDSAGCSASDTIQVILKDCSTIAEYNAIGVVTIWPNPAAFNNPIFVSIDAYVSGNFNLLVYDMNGKQYPVNYRYNNGTFEMEGNLSAGVYLLNVINDDQVFQIGRLVVLD